MILNITIVYFFWLTIKKYPSCKVLIFKIRLTRPYICKIFLFYKYSSVTLYSKYYLFLLDFQCFFQSFLVCVCSIFCLVYALMFMWYLVWVCIVCDLFSALLRFSFFCFCYVFVCTDMIMFEYWHVMFDGVIIVYYLLCDASILTQVSCFCRFY